MARRQNPKIERTLKRTSSLRLVKQTFLIVCEGEVTEPEYFNSFRLTSANVKAIGKGMNTISLVKEAIAIQESFDGSNPAKEESSTTVHQLVEQLLQFIE